MQRDLGNSDSMRNWMPSFGPRCSWRRRNSRLYLFLQERRCRFMITNPEGAALLELLVNNIVPLEDQDIEMNNPNSLIPARDENPRGNNYVVPQGNQPRHVGLPRGFIGGGRIHVRLPADNDPNRHEDGPRRKQIQLINAQPRAQNYVGESPGFAWFFGVHRLLAGEDLNTCEDEDSDDDDDTDEEDEEDEEMDVQMEAEEEKDFTNTPSELDEL